MAKEPTEIEKRQGAEDRARTIQRENQRGITLGTSKPLDVARTRPAPKFDAPDSDRENT